MRWILDPSGLRKSGGHWPNQTLSSNACLKLEYPNKSTSLAFNYLKRINKYGP